MAVPIFASFTGPKGSPIAMMSLCRHNSTKRTEQQQRNRSGLTLSQVNEGTMERVLRQEATAVSPMEVDDDVGATSTTTTVDPKWSPFLESTGLDRSTIPLIASAHEKVKNNPVYDLLDRSQKAAALRREMPVGRNCLAEEGHAEQALDVLEPPPTTAINIATGGSVAVRPPPPQQHVAWGDLSQATKSLPRKTPPNPLPEDQPRQWIGRDKAELQVKFVAKQNFLKRRTNDHGEFAFLVASGPGKTRTGIETPRLVKEVCTELSQWAHQTCTTALRFSDPVYLKIDFLNGARFDPLFDTWTLPSSEALGARLVKSFYGDPAVPLKRVTHVAALSHIVKWIQRQEKSDVVVPIVIHMDEFGDFIQARNVEFGFADEKGKEFFLNMLRDIGSAATVETNERIELSKLHNAGKYFIVPITTGTSHSESNIGGIRKYGLHVID